MLQNKLIKSTNNLNKQNKINKILVFGNNLIKGDSLTFNLIPKLQKIYQDIKFKEFDPTENLEGEIQNRSLFILDVAKGIKDLKILNIFDLDNLELSIYSMHDFDLAYNIKLLKKLEKLKHITIIAIPPNIKETEALIKIKKAIEFLR